MLRGYRRGGVWGDGFAGSPGGGAR
jgi:hypothetical protein